MVMVQKKEVIAYIASIIYASIFGLSFLFSKRALEVAAPLQLISFRFLLAFMMLTLLVVLRVVKVDYRGKSLKDLVLLSITQPVLYFIFETYGIQHSSSSYAGLIMALIPIMVSIMGIFFLEEYPSRVQWTFILLSVVGVIYIVFKDSSSNSQNTLLGTALLLMAVLVGSYYNILSRKSSVHFSSIDITYFMMGAGAVVFNGISIVLGWMDGAIHHYFQPLFNRDFLISILYLGILSSNLAFFLMNYALSALPASKAVIFGNLSTVVSIVAGVVVLKEAFYFYHFIGSALIISGIVGTNYFNTRSTQKGVENLALKEKSRL